MHLTLVQDARHIGGFNGLHKTKVHPNQRHSVCGWEVRAPSIQVGHIGVLKPMTWLSLSFVKLDFVGSYERYLNYYAWPLQ
jgi:hypothetical protein